MKGVFRKSHSNKLFAVLAFIAGAFLTFRFTFWGIQAVNSSESLASIISCFIAALFGIVVLFTGIFLFAFNSEPYLEITAEGIDVRTGWMSNRYIKADEIVDVTFSINSVAVETNEHTVIIPGLINSSEVFRYITEIMPENHAARDTAGLRSRYRVYRRNYVVSTVVSAVCMVLMFFAILFCVYLTGGKDLSDFDRTQDLIFIGFVVFEALIITAMIIASMRAGKTFRQMNLLKHSICASEASSRRNEGLEEYSGIIEVLGFAGGTGRIIIISKDDRYIYFAETYEENGWKSIDDNIRSFDLLSELYEDIEFRFPDTKPDK